MAGAHHIYAQMTQCVIIVQLKTVENNVMSVLSHLRCQTTRIKLLSTEECKIQRKEVDDMVILIVLRLQI